MKGFTSVSALYVSLAGFALNPVCHIIFIKEWLWQEERDEVLSSRTSKDTMVCTDIFFVCFHDS